jgi:hypothetical protein
MLRRATMASVILGELTLVARLGEGAFPKPIVASCTPRLATLRGRTVHGCLP